MRGLDCTGAGAGGGGGAAAATGLAGAGTAAGGGAADAETGGGASGVEGATEADGAADEATGGGAAGGAAAPAGASVFAGSAGFAGAGSAGFAGEGTGVDVSDRLPNIFRPLSYLFFLPRDLRKPKEPLSFFVSAGSFATAPAAASAIGRSAFMISAAARLTPIGLPEASPAAKIFGA